MPHLLFIVVSLMVVLRYYCYRHVLHVMRICVTLCVISFHYHNVPIMHVRNMVGNHVASILGQPLFSDRALLAPFYVQICHKTRFLYREVALSLPSNLQPTGHYGTLLGPTKPKLTRLRIHLCRACN